MRSSPLRYLGLLLVVLLLAGGVLACDIPGLTGGGPSQPSTPTISVTAPTSGAEFQVGEVVNVLSSSSDARGITRVELYVDGVLYRTDASPNPSGNALVSLSQAWIAERPGTHSLSVVAVNVDGQESDPWAVTLRVAGEAASPSPSPTTEEAPLPTVTPTVPPPPPPTATLPPPTPTVNPNAPVIKYFRANGQNESYTAFAGEPVTLSWEWQNVLSGHLAPGNQPLVCETMPCYKVVTPSATTTYTLKATNATATTTKSVTVKIG